MPVATNNLLVVEQRLWVIALAWPALSTPGLDTTIRVGNIIRFDGTSGWPDKTKIHRQVADAPELKLEIGGGRPDPKAPRTFCLQPDVTAVAFDWTVTVADKRYGVLTQVLAELKAAMKNTDSVLGGGVAAGVQLGIPAVVCRWEPEMRPGRAGDNQRSMVWTMRVVIKG